MRCCNRVHASAAAIGRDCMHCDMYLLDACMEYAMRCNRQAFVTCIQILMYSDSDVFRYCCNREALTACIQILVHLYSYSLKRTYCCDRDALNTCIHAAWHAFMQHDMHWVLQLHSCTMHCTMHCTQSCNCDALTIRHIHATIARPWLHAFMQYETHRVL